MNLTETLDLLTLIAAVDNRKFGEETVAAWQELLIDVEFADARAAVQRHRSTATDYLMPVHVIAGARTARLELVDSAPTCRTCQGSVIGRYHLRHCAGQTAIEAAPEDRTADVGQLLADLRDKLPSADERNFRRAEVLEWERQRDRDARAEPNPHYDPAALAEGA